MKHELFIEQPSADLKEGIKVTKETSFEYEKEGCIKQSLKELILYTELKVEGSNGINSYKSKSNIELKLNEGDILLFDEKRGYYMPSYPVATIDDAIDTINSLSNIPRFKEGE